MTLEYRFQKGQFVVIGPPDEMTVGTVRVRRLNGEFNTETVVKLLAVFDTPDGPRQYGILRTLPKRARPKREPRYDFPVTTRKVDE